VVNVLAVLVGHASDSHRDQLLPTVLSPTYASIVVAATGVLIVSHAIDSRLTQLSLAAVATVAIFVVNHRFLKSATRFQNSRDSLAFGGSCAELETFPRSRYNSGEVFRGVSQVLGQASRLTPLRSTCSKGASRTGVGQDSSRSPDSTVLARARRRSCSARRCQLTAFRP